MANLGKCRLQVLIGCLLILCFANSCTGESALLTPTAASTPTPTFTNTMTPSATNTSTPTPTFTPTPFGGAQGRVAFYSSTTFGLYEFASELSTDLFEMSTTQNSEYIVSPNGLYIALIIDWMDGRENSRLWILDVRSGVYTEVENIPGNINHYGSSWSPDSNWFAMLVVSRSIYKLYLVDNIGVEMRQIPENLPAEIFVKMGGWSPDSRSVVITSDLDGGNDSGGGAVFSYDIYSDRMKRITLNVENYHPEYSPDGTMIAFYSNRDGGSATDVFVVYADGRVERRLTRNFLTEGTTCLHHCVNYLLGWSPDGSSVVYRRWDANTADYHQYVCMIGVDRTNDICYGENEGYVETTIFPDESPWSPNGEMLVVHCSRDGIARLCVVNIAANVLTEIPWNKGNSDSIRYSWSPDSRNIIMDGLNVYSVDTGTVQELIPGSNPEWLP